MLTHRHTDTQTHRHTDKTITVPFRLRYAARVMNPDGHSLWDNKSTDARKNGVLKQPFGTAILPNECIAVTETGSHCVAIFSKEGRLLFRFGGKGSDQGQFLGPKGIAVRLSKELVVVDSGNHRIQIFSLDSLQLR